MPDIPEADVKNWPHLLHIAEQLRVGSPLDDGSYLFRGHENIAWRLEPTLHRAVRSDDPSKALPDAKKLLDIERRSTEHFKSLAPIHLPTSILFSTDTNLDWWTVMRHHGAPSRLLDWTGSFFVAVYFASRAQYSTDGVVYSVHNGTLAAAMASAHPDAAHVPANQLDGVCTDASATDTLALIKRLKGQSDRMIAQQGGFMLCHNVRGDVESILATELPKVADPSTLVLRKWKIPRHLKADFMWHLRTMNVSGNSLFPGLDGVGLYLKEAAELTQRV